MRIGYSYIRFSTPDQIRGDSYRRQLDLSVQYAAKHNIELDTTLQLHDLGVSAFRGLNAVSGKLKLFMDAVDSGTVKPGSVLLVESLDRLSRDQVMVALSQFTQLLGKDIAVVTLNDEREYNKESINDLGNLIISIVIMSRAHEESSTKSKRSLSAWKAKRQNAVAGITTTPLTPGWIRAVSGKRDLIPKRAALIKRMFQMANSGMGRHLITKQFNREGIDTWGHGASQARKGKGWDGGYIGQILKNRAVIGELIPHKLDEHKKRVPQEAIPGYYPRVVTDEVFAVTQALLVSRTHKGGEVGSGGNLFSGLLQCADCEGSLIIVSKNTKSGKRLVCDQGRRARSECKWKPWVYDDFERQVLGDVREIDIAAVFGDGNVTDQLEGQIAALDMKLTDLRAKLEQLVDIAEQPGGQARSILDRINKLELETVELEATRAQLQEQIRVEKAKFALQARAGEDIEVLLKRLATAPKDQAVQLRLKLRAHIRSLISQITVDLIEKEILVVYVGPLATTKTRLIKDGQSSVFVMDDPDW